MGSLRQQQQNLEKILRDIEERLQALETAQRAGYTSIGGGGAMQLLDASGNPVARLGAITGGYGIEVNAGSGFKNVIQSASTVASSGGNVQGDVNSLNSSISSLSGRVSSLESFRSGLSASVIPSAGSNVQNDVNFLSANKANLMNTAVAVAHTH